MGINNLSSFVDEVGLRKTYRLSNTNVVIDGYNLYHVLYKQFSEDKPNDYLFGGTYTEYTKPFKQFFTKLRQCNINPIVVFDGGDNLQLNDNRMDRFKHSLDKSKILYENPPKIENKRSTKELIFPHLMSNLFKFVVKIMKVQCYTTKLDADLEMAKLANDLNCPLISNDSDFFVMDIKKGVISCDSLKRQKPLKWRKQHYIKCRIYKIDDLLKFRTSYKKTTELKAEMLPLFGSLLGNDLIDGQLLDDFFEEIVIPPEKVKKNKSNQELRHKRWGQINQSLNWLSKNSCNANDAICIAKSDFLFQEVIKRRKNVRHKKNWTESQLFKHKRWQRMEQLLCWLAINFRNANQAILHIESHLKQNPIVLQLFRDSLKSYDTNGKSFLKELLDHKILETNEDHIPIEMIVNERQLPKWLLMEYFFTNKLNSFVFTMIYTKVRNIRPVVEDFSLESPFDLSIRLKRILFSLCRTNRNEEKPFRLTIRKGDSFQEIPILPKTHMSGTVSGDKQLPILSEIRELSEIERKRLLLDILEIDEKLLIDLENDLVKIKLDRKDIEFWKYFLIVIKYWNSNAIIKKFRFQVIRAFVQSVIYFRHNSMITNEFKGMTSVKYCLGQRFEPFVIHYYSEIQSIYSSINNLVALLGDPIPGPELLHYFNGILLYNLFQKIKDIEANYVNPFNENRLNRIYNFIIGSIFKT